MLIGVMDTQLAGLQVGKGREARFSEASPDLQRFMYGYDF